MNEKFFKDLNTSNVVYCLTVRASGLQYIGQTTHTFKNRLRDHRVFKEYGGYNGLIIERLYTLGEDRFCLDFVEGYCMGVYKTIQPYGLNIKPPSLSIIEQIERFFPEQKECIDYLYRCAFAYNLRNSNRCLMPKPRI